MAALRVSSYRKLFEEESWSRNGGSGASVRGAAVDKCDCDKLDFVAAKELNKEGLTRFVQDRTVIAALNDRLVRLIELAHCFEEENESLEWQIAELEEKLKSRQASSSSGITSVVVVPDYSLDAVVERLRRERDEILCDTEELQKELERLMQEYEAAAQQRIFLQQQRREVAEEVDAVTAGCLALREQVAIYEEQLANMEAQHKTEVETLLDPAEGAAGAVAAITFGIPDITPALDVKEYYCQLAESLQYDGGAASSAQVRSGDGKQLEVGGAAGSTVRDLSEIKDPSEMKALMVEKCQRRQKGGDETHQETVTQVKSPELQKEIAELEKCNEELEDEVDVKTAAHMDEIAELECTVDEMRHQDADFQVQMQEQVEDYRELLSEKMARDMEITAYRSLMEEEEERLCSL